MDITKVLTVVKSLPYKIIFYIFLGLCAVGVTHAIEQHFSSQTQNNYQRLLDGKLTEKEKAFQAVNNKLGVAQSTIMTQANLNKQLASENSDMKKWIKDNKVNATSVDNATATITTKDCGKLTLSMSETVYKQKSGLLESSDLKIKVTGADGKEIPVTITDHTFSYVDKPLTISWYQRLGVTGQIMGGSNTFISAIGVGYQFGPFFVGPQIGITVNGAGLTTIYGASLVWYPFSN